MGRVGYRHLGVPISGVMDERSAQLSNLLLNNDLHDAVLEIDEMGATLFFTEPTWIVLTGGIRGSFFNNQKIQLHKPIATEAGDIMEIKPIHLGRWSYLAVKGGLNTSVHLGSRSSYPPAELGTPYLKKGQKLPFLSIECSLKFNTNSRVSTLDHFNKEKVRVLPGPEYDHIAKKATLNGLTFSIGSNSNRMAYLLEGDKMNIALKEIITAPVFPGTIQLPPSGIPVVLMRDAQTTGGYPRILQVLREDLDVLAQKKVGDMIQLELIRD